MYILIVSRGYPTEKYAANGIFEFEQALALRDSGHKVVLAAVDLRSIRRWRRWGIERIEKEGIEVWSINIPCGNMPKDILYRAGIFGLKILYKKIYSQHGAPDIVHAHFGRIGFISLKALSENKLPIVITEHLSLVLTKKLKNFEISCLKSCVEESNAFICVSSALKRSVLQLTGSNKNIYVVPNMVSPLFKYKSKQSNKENFLFLSVGNLVESKRFDITIDAFSKAFQGNEAVKLYIGGNGPQRGYLKQKINELKMNNQIFLIGQLTRQEVVEKMHECDVFVLASDFETFGVYTLFSSKSGFIPKKPDLKCVTSRGLIPHRFRSIPVCFLIVSIYLKKCLSPAVNMLIIPR
jgi:glycosyltransferase involved in cell wall biosynthesis